DQVRRRELLELLDLALEARGFERALGDQHQPVGLERLFDEVVGALLDGGDRGFDVAMAGNHHHRRFRMLRLHGVEQLQAVEAAPLQPDVEVDQAWPSARHLRQRVVAVARRARHIAFVLQNSRYQFANVRFVVNNKDVFGHDYSPVASLGDSVTRGDPGSAEPAGAAEKRSRIHAPRCPGILSDASPSSMRPPWSSKIRPTMARPSPVPLSRVVTYGSSKRLRFSL